MDREKFEQIAKPGDLVFIVVNHDKGPIDLRRNIRCGIYERHTTPEIFWLRYHGEHIMPSERDNRHNFAFDTHPSGMKFKTVASVQVGLGREQLAQQIGNFLDDMAEQDYRSRWDKEFGY